MFSAALLVCTTLVSNGVDGTVAVNTCEVEAAPIVATAPNSFEKLSLRVINDVTAAVEVVQPNPTLANVRPTIALPPQAEIHQGSVVVKLAHRVPHMNSSKTRIIAAADVTLVPRKSLSFWDKLKQEPAKSFNPTATN